MNSKKIVDRFNGFVDCYDIYRPTPPSIVNEIIIEYLRKRPTVIVDLGCGTGLSTFIWRPYAEYIVGIDPNKEMLTKAIDKVKPNEHIDFIIGYANEKILEENSVDVITCSSSFQWMEPKSTINEVMRILKDDGIYAIYNYDNPPKIDRIIEKSYRDLFQKIYIVLDEDSKLMNEKYLWTSNDYIKHMKNKFRFIKDITFRHKVKMNSKDFIGFILSQGALQAILKLNHPLKNDILKLIKLVELRLTKEEYIATFSYRLRIAIK